MDSWNLINLSHFPIYYLCQKITDALDEDDVEKYIFLFIPYNIAVILLCLGLFSIVYFRYKIGIIQVLNWSVGIFGYQIIQSYIGSTINLSFILIWVYCTRKWWHDTWWLLIKPESEYQEYIKELEGKKTPEFDTPGKGYKLFKYIRGRIVKKKLPDFKEVRLELHPSPIEGIGVFAARKIAIGNYIAEGIHAEDFNSIVSWNTLRIWAKL